MKQFTERGKGKESQIRVKMAISGKVKGVLRKTETARVNLGKVTAS
jgi:hypothetical protein